MSGTRRYICFALVASLCLAAGCAPRDDNPIAPDFVFAGHPPGPTLSCGYSRASLSPDGRMFVLTDPGDYLQGEAWPFSIGELNPRRSAVIDTGCVSASGSLSACQVGTIQAGGLAKGARAWWSSDSRNVFINAGGAIGAFATDLVAKRISLIDEPREHRFMNPWTIAVVGPTPSRTRTEEWKRIHAAEKWFASVRNPLFGQGALSSMRVTLGLHDMTASGTISESLELGALRSSADDVEKTGYLVTVFMGEQRPMLLQDERGVDWLVGMGEALRRTAAATADGRRWESGPSPDALGKRPILDSSSGRLLGIHTERQIVWVYPEQDLLALGEALLAALPPQGTLHQIEVSRDGRVAVMLHFDKPSGAVGHSVAVGGDRGPAWRVSSTYCRRDGESPVSAVPPSAVRTAVTYDAGEAGWPLVARLTRTARADRLVIYLHGGPGGSVLYDDVSDPHGWVARGSGDVVSYDPSGTIGVNAGVAERLSRFGGEALSRDARLIGADVRRLSVNYREVVLYAASFGAALVPGVFREIDGIIARAYLVAPLAAHHHPSTNLRARENDAKDNLSEKFAVLFHEVHMGNRPMEGKLAFHKWLADQYAKFNLDARFIVVQGASDELSRPGDIPNPGAAKMVVVDGGHDAAQWHRETICWLVDECGSEGPTSPLY